MHPDILAQACRLFQTSPDKLIPLLGGHYNAVYRYPLDLSPQAERESDNPGFGILRIGVEDCPPEQTLGMLDWVHYLHEHGAPVAPPIASSYGRYLERLELGTTSYTVTAFEEADGTLAERIPPEQWTDELFIKIGKAVGKFHSVSKGFIPSQPAYPRPQWFNSFEIREALTRLTTASDPELIKLTDIISEFQQLPTRSSEFGLIHGDLHFANFLVQPGGEVTIIDFDDCAYGWFAMDVAMALFDVLVLYGADNAEELKAFAKRFMRNYLAGYRSENELPANWLALVPRFLKLKEICVYVPLIGHPDINLPDTWVGRFMRGRAGRIANDLAYVDIEFTDRSICG